MYLNSDAMKRLKLLVRRSIVFPLAVLPAMSLLAQQDGTENMPNLVFPKFEQATVKLKTGQSYNVVLNYEKAEQEMLVRRNGQFYLFKDNQSVDTIFIGDRVFVPATKGFYEVLVNSPISLFIQHKCDLENEGSTVAYGSKTNTAGITHITTIYGKEGAITLKIPENYKVIDASVMWIRKNGEMHRVQNKNQFMKVFPEWKKELAKYFKENAVDFKKADDVSQLVIYCNKL
jgi:hypothetical protein